jgi:pSer/pThr/pTyr-binding forkhead associated (FHA) protein
MQNDTLIIKDCNSTNGVKINGLKVVAHVLSNGEIAQIGRYKLRFITSIANNKSESKSESHDTLTTEQLVH